MDNGYGLKQFTPRRRNRKSVEPLSGEKMALVIVGLIIVALFLGTKFITKFNGTQDKAVTLAYSEYYYPSETTDLYAARRLMNAMTEAQKFKCPNTSLRMAYNLINVNSSTQSKVSVAYELTTKGYLKAVDDVTNNANSATSGTMKMTDLYYFPEPASDMYYPLIAPFNFNFRTANTDGSTITIESEDKTMVITFDNVLCWFCGMKGTNVNYEDLVNHRSHGDVVGDSANSSVTSGSAGCIVGFGGQNTTVRFECLNSEGVMSSASWDTLCNAPPTKK